MKTWNAVNTVVEPYLWEIETQAWLFFIPIAIALNRTYERLKPFVISIMTPPNVWLNRTYERLKLFYSIDKKICNNSWTVPMRDWNFKVPRIAPILYLQGWTVPTSEQCALYTVINVDEKERKPEQLMSVRQIWIVRVFIFLSCLCIVY